MSVPAGLHVAAIMDGNGRWATARGLPRVAGHRRGAEALRALVEASPELGIGTLTVFAFSADNWKRPPEEVHALLRLFGEYLRSDIGRLRDAQVRLTVIGRRTRLPSSLVDQIAAAENATLDCASMHVRLAIDYSARDAIASAAAAAVRAGDLTRESIACRVASGRGDTAPVPDVDLLIRTGGERRLSDFLLWECAYAELWFTDTRWPDFTPRELASAVADFRGRSRRFGAVSPTQFPELAGRK